MKRPNEKGDLASEKRLMRDRSKKMIQDFKETYSMTTESRYANAHLEFKPDIAPKPMAGRQDALPKWHRWVERFFHQHVFFSSLPSCLHISHRTRPLTSTIPGFH